MIRIPTFNILALGLGSITRWMTLDLLDPLFKILYTASVSLQALLFLSSVCPVYFADFKFTSSPLTLSSFSGSGVTVYGTSITTNVSGIQNPTWECLIDNNSIGSSNSSSSANLGNQNNWILCGAGPFQDGPHMLTVNANVSNQQTFWFDQIQYTPSASVSLNQQLLYIDAGDPAIKYDGVWTRSAFQLPMGPNTGSHYTQFLGNTSSSNEPGAVITYQFSGS